MSENRDSTAPWWRGAAIYQIYPRSFQDTNGDGIGDLRGITERLPYVADLGVDAIWISPFYTSPMRDFGYDVSDYCDIDPTFGTLADFDALIARAHELGLKVIVDQVAQVGQRAEDRIDAAVVGHVVAEVAHRRSEHRADPDHVDAQALDVAEPRADAGQVADAVAVAVLKAARIDLVDEHAGHSAGGSSRFLGHIPSPHRRAAFAIKGV